MYPGATARGVERTADGWTLRCDREDGSALRLEAPWLIDATENPPPSDCGAG